MIFIVLAELHTVSANQALLSDPSIQVVFHCELPSIGIYKHVFFPHFRQIHDKKIKIHKSTIDITNKVGVC